MNGFACVESFGDLDLYIYYPKAAALFKNRQDLRFSVHAFGCFLSSVLCQVSADILSLALLSYVQYLLCFFKVYALVFHL